MKVSQTTWMEKFDEQKRLLAVVDPKNPPWPKNYAMSPGNADKIASVKISAEYQALSAKGIAPVPPNFEGAKTRIEWTNIFEAWASEVVKLASKHVKAEVAQSVTRRIGVKEYHSARVYEVKQSQLYKDYVAAVKENRVKIKFAKDFWTREIVERIIQTWIEEMEKALGIYKPVGDPSDFDMYMELHVKPALVEVKKEPFYEEFEDEVKTEPLIKKELQVKTVTITSEKEFKQLVNEKLMIKKDPDLSDKSKVNKDLLDIYQEFEDEVKNEPKEEPEAKKRRL